jgi:putative ubiquitin-RnfH superfamily antitoxin RatB of RatAB toxin-antitoxin module
MAIDGSLIAVEVVYALPDRQTVIALTAKQSDTISEIIAQSGILERHSEIDLAVNAVGIFGRRVVPMDYAEDGDRIEIYRPLIADPKEARLKRARGQRR